MPCVLLEVGIVLEKEMKSSSASFSMKGNFIRMAHKKMCIECAICTSFLVVFFFSFS